MTIDQVREFLADSERRVSDAAAVGDYRARVTSGVPYEDVVGADEFAARYLE